MLKDQLGRALDRRRDRGILRSLKRFNLVNEENAQGAKDEEGANALVDFSSNDYIGLARCKEMKLSIIEQMKNDLQASSSSSSVGSTGSRLLDGNSKEHERLEERLARHFGSSDALLFNSGYDANTSLLGFLPQPDDFIVYDELAHASMHDGMRASRINKAHRIAFKHNDLNDFEAKLEGIVRASSATEPNVFVAVEAIYSMDGDACPLRGLVDIVNAKVAKGKRCIIVDEAHSVGLYGLNGAGLCDALGLCSEIDVRLVTFGKAFGCSGAAVLCDALVRLYLINYARPLIYSTAIAHPALYAVNAALDILSTPNGALRAARTFELTQAFTQQIRTVIANVNADGALTAPISMNASSAEQERSTLPNPPIVPIITPNAKELAQYLIANGFLVRPISYPTVPKGSERVRVCIHAHNEHEDVLTLARFVEQWVYSQMQDRRGSQKPRMSGSGDVEKAKL